MYKSLFSGWLGSSVLVSALLLSACAPWSDKKEQVYAVQYAPLGEKAMPWVSRAQSLTQLETFSLKGTLEAHAHGHKGAHLSFQWLQTPHYYQFKLFDSVGRIYLDLLATPQKAQLRIKGKVYVAKRGEPLLQQHLGVNLPISYFSSWLKGLPAIRSRHERILTPTYHLLKLHQAGWFVRYLRYHKIRTHDLPSQILMTKGDWHARILVTHWTL